MGLDIVELVMEVEKEFGVDLPDSELRRIETVGELHDLVANQLGASEAPDRERLWVRLLDVIEREQGLERERLIRTARFVKDLGLA